MANFTIEETYQLEDNSNDDIQVLNNLKKIRSGDGTFNIAQGRIELRDSSGNIVVLLDANG